MSLLGIDPGSSGRTAMALNQPLSHLSSPALIIFNDLDISTWSLTSYLYDCEIILAGSDLRISCWVKEKDFSGKPAGRQGGGSRQPRLSSVVSQAQSCIGSWEACQLGGYQDRIWSIREKTHLRK